MKNRTLTAVLALFSWCMISCTSGKSSAGFPVVYYAPEYAGGFSIVGEENRASRVIRVTAPWQDADSVAMELFLARDGELPPEGFSGQVIREKAERIVAMSSSYIAMLDMLGACDRVVAVSGKHFIANDYVSSSDVADVGSEANVDFETLVSVSPDIVLLYGISASSPVEAMLRKLGIPYIYIGEYLEPSPLGKAEWTVALSELIGERERGEAVFGELSERYNALKSMVPEDIDRPCVMLNTPYGDTWFMSSGASAMAKMIEDAGAAYVYEGNDSNRSMPVDMEEAYLLASKADFWLNVGKTASLGELAASYPKFASVRSVTGRRVYNCDRRVNRTGGNDFWESGQMRPDIVLSDLIGIFHPELAMTDSLYYYRRLD